MLRYNDIKSHENVSDNIRLSSFQADTQGYKLEPISLLKHVPLFAPSLPFFISLFLPVRFPSVEIQTNRKETKKRAKMDNVLEGPSVTSSGRVKKKKKKNNSQIESGRYRGSWWIGWAKVANGCCTKSSWIKQNEIAIRFSSRIVRWLDSQCFGQPSTQFHVFRANKFPDKNLNYFETESFWYPGL